MTPSSPKGNRLPKTRAGQLRLLGRGKAKLIAFKSSGPSLQETVTIQSSSQVTLYSRSPSVMVGIGHFMNVDFSLRCRNIP